MEQSKMSQMRTVLSSLMARYLSFLEERRTPTALKEQQTTKLNKNQISHLIKAYCQAIRRPKIQISKMMPSALKRSKWSFPASTERTKIMIIVVWTVTMMKMKLRMRTEIQQRSRSIIRVVWRGLGLSEAILVQPGSWTQSKAALTWIHRCILSSKSVPKKQLCKRSTKDWYSNRHRSETSAITTRSILWTRWSAYKKMETRLIIIKRD